MGTALKLESQGYWASGCFISSWFVRDSTVKMIDQMPKSLDARRSAPGTASTRVTESTPTQSMGQVWVIMFPLFIGPQKFYSLLIHKPYLTLFTIYFLSISMELEYLLNASKFHIWTGRHTSGPTYSTICHRSR